jgi:DNA repair protein RadC
VDAVVVDIEEAACPACGTTVPLRNDLPENDFFRPWNLAHGRKAVRAYVESLGEEAHEWLLALYVNGHLELLAVDTVARGDASGCPVPLWKLIDRGHSLKAQGFILVHNHPSGDSTPSCSDIQVTRKLAYISHELNVPLLDHLVFARGELHEIGCWSWGGHPYAAGSH